MPTADTQVWFENRATTQQGMERLFHSPALAPNQDFTYTIKARWTDNGQAVTRERQAHVRAGQNITVDFRTSDGDKLPSPLPQLPSTSPRK